MSVAVRSVLFLLCILGLACAAKGPQCCPQGYIEGRNCEDGSPISLQDKCEKKFFIDPNKYQDERFEINSDGYLKLPRFDDTDSYVTYEPHLYCVGRFNASLEDVAVVCVTEGSWYNLRAICSFISVFFLILTITVYLVVPRLRDLQGKCILHAIVALAVAFFTLALMQITQVPGTLCIFSAFTLYATFMAAFSWLNVVAFNVWRTTVIPNLCKRTENQWHLIYCLYGYGLPTCLVVGALCAHLAEGEHIKPGFGEAMCFFSGTVPTWAYFYGPISVLLTANVILFIWSSVKLWHADAQQNTPKLRNLKYRFLLTMKLFLIMGLLWIFEVVSYAGQDLHEYLNYLWVITDYLNIMQGVLIFLVLVVFRKKALRELASNTFIGSKLPRSWKTLQDEECCEEEDSVAKDTNKPV